MHFNFKIGEDESEVKENVDNRNRYFRNQGIKVGFENIIEKEKHVFFCELKKAYINIVKKYMNIDSD